MNIVSGLFATSLLALAVRAENWAVHVSQGAEAAHRLAEDHGLVNLGEVIPDTNLFHFKLATSTRDKRSDDDLVKEIHNQLDLHPDIGSVQLHSTPLKRSKRLPLPEKRQASNNREVCFINTVRTEDEEPRRCIFPFAYKGKTYVQCTADHSVNGKEWCATEVRPDGEVITGQWGDCDKKAVTCFAFGPDGEKRPVAPPRRPQAPQQPGQPRQFLPPQGRLPPPPPQRGLPPQFAQGRRPPPPFGPPPPQFQRGQFAPQGQVPPFPQGAGAVPPGFPPPRFPPGSQGQSLNPFGPQRVGNVGNLVENEVPEVPVDPKSFKTYLNDKSWPKMWFLNRGKEGLDMNVEDAWAQGYTGKNVKVTILDDGIEHTHDDLKANYDPEASIDLNEDDGDPFPRYDYFNSNKHGTRCAGTVAAAANNSACAVGIAYDSKIGGIRILDGQILDILEARALSFNRDYIDIYSASWGPDDNGRTVDGPGDLARKALRDGAEKGRNGKGSIFVWASGNGGKYLDSCSADGYSTSIYTLSISSASENGLIPWYSESCSSSMATTYSSGSKRLNERKVVTTDLHGKCTDQHTGTSASSPMAAAIVALMLEANPDLTWRDVQHITVRNARPEGNLKANDWAENGVGLKFSHAFGFGLMDAGEMTKMAKDWETVPTQKKCTTPEKILAEPVIIGPQQEQMVTLDAELCDKIQHIEHMQLEIDLRTTAKRGDLTVMVKSPSGTTSILLAPRPFDDVRTGLEKFAQWPMMSVHFWGEPVEKESDSKWTLSVTNNGDRAAMLYDFQLTFFGTEEDPQPKKPIKLTKKPANDPLASEVTQLGEDEELDPNVFSTPTDFIIDDDFRLALAVQDFQDNEAPEEEEVTTTTEVVTTETASIDDQSTLKAFVDVVADELVDDNIEKEESTTALTDIDTTEDVTQVVEEEDSDEVEVEPTTITVTLAEVEDEKRVPEPKAVSDTVTDVVEEDTVETQEAVSAED